MKWFWLGGLELKQQVFFRCTENEDRLLEKKREKFSTLLEVVELSLPHDGGVTGWSLGMPLQNGYRHGRSGNGAGRGRTAFVSEDASHPFHSCSRLRPFASSSSIIRELLVHRC